MIRRLYAILVLFLFVSTLSAGTTGKIAGFIKDASSGEPLVGVNVFLEGTSLGAATDVDGYFVILNIPPGPYDVRISYIGYKDHLIKDAEVNIDLTTRIDVELKQNVMETEQVVVVAKAPVIQKDITGSQQVVTTQDINALPVTTLTEAIGLQAGVTQSLQIRGSGSDQVSFMVDGVTLRDERNNSPITFVPLSSVTTISVQAGGADAQYNNARSGVVNVVTKEGNLQNYTGTITIRGAGTQQKHFGSSPYGPDSYFNRPYLDPAVAWTGTKNGAWTSYERRQYPDFNGWNAVAAATLTDNDPTNDLTPEAAQRIFMWQHRKQGDIHQADYDIDMGFGGRVPVVSKALGNLRFYASFKKRKDMYLFAVSEDAKTDFAYMLKLTSDLSRSKKLSFLALYNVTSATSASRSGGTGIISSVAGEASLLNSSGHTGSWRLWTDQYLSPTRLYSTALSLKFTNVLSSKSYYELQAKSVIKRYRTGPGPARNLEKNNEIFPGYFVDEAPAGYFADPLFGIDGLGMGGSIGNSRDTSNIVTNTLLMNYVNQFDKNNEIKAGFTFDYDDLNMNFGSVNKALPEGNFRTKFKRNPYRLSAYIQDKMEYEGFIATAGVIADYTNPNGKWYNVDPYNVDFFTSNYSPGDDAKYLTKDAKPQLTFSPRLGISHPISENAKLYFNYGHYRQIATSEGLYRLQRGTGDKLTRIGNPLISLAKTVSYELGYDHSLSDTYLLHMAAYYKDVSNQQDWTRYIGAGASGSVNYFKLTNKSYEDIRGLEASITKRSGDWITGTVNYEYRVGTSGFFGVKQNFLDPGEQRNYLAQNPQQNKPLPQPRIKSNIDIHTPFLYGPKYFDQYPFANWHMNFITYWTAGSHFTWNPQKIPGISSNVQYKDYLNVDLKITKKFNFGPVDLKFFADIFNLFNEKHFSGLSFSDAFDYDDYMKSLHLPNSVRSPLGYDGISGSDGPGDVRKTGVDFVPMEWSVNSANSEAWNHAAIYYDASTKNYMEYNSTSGEWVVANSSKIKKILDDKAYIDMPNHTYFTFLNPRQIFFGLQLSYNF